MSGSQFFRIKVKDDVRAIMETNDAKRRFQRVKRMSKVGLCDFLGNCNWSSSIYPRICGEWRQRLMEMLKQSTVS